MFNSKVSNLNPIAPDLGFVEDNEPVMGVGVETFSVICDTKLSKALKLLYDHCCQVCVHSANFGAFVYSEPHHIQPLGRPHDWPDSVDNLLALCPNHHVEFDYGLMSVDEDIHKDDTNEYVCRRLMLKGEHVCNQKCFVSLYCDFNKSQ